MSKTKKNAIGREIPLSIPGVRNVRPFMGAFARVPEEERVTRVLPVRNPGDIKLLGSLEEAVEKSGLKSGMTIGFHHHLRNGDRLLCRLMDVIAKRGIKNLCLASTSLFKTHAPLIEHIRSGVITRIESGIHDAIGNAIFTGDVELQAPMIVRSHGGRARAIEAGDLPVDVAFLSAPSADAMGNLNGVLGPSACGALGYPMTDALYAHTVVAITDHLVPYPNRPISIAQHQVDFVCTVDSLGDPKGIVSGTTRITTNPLGHLIARNTMKLMIASGLVVDGFSFQTGAGGTSLAVAHYLREHMKENKIVGSFGSGGITAYFVQMLKEGLFRRLMDVQCFDLDAVASLRDNPDHIEMSGSMYGNPHNRGAVVNNLDMVVLGATEVDLDFNVNVAVDSDGVLRHAVGGHQDTAAGAKLTIIVAPLIRGRLNTILEKCTVVTTPGETIDAIVTERGMAINPRRPELIDKAKAAGLPVMPIHDLMAIGQKLTGKPTPVEFEDKILGVMEYRDGTVIDVARKPILHKR